MQDRLIEVLPLSANANTKGVVGEGVKVVGSAAVGGDVGFVLFNFRVPQALVASPSFDHFLQVFGVFQSVALSQELKITVPVADVPHDPRVIKQPTMKIKKAPVQNVGSVVGGGTPYVLAM